MEANMKWSSNPKTHILAFILTGVLMFTMFAEQPMLTEPAQPQTLYYENGVTKEQEQTQQPQQQPQQQQPQQPQQQQQPAVVAPKWEFQLPICNQMFNESSLAGIPLTASQWWVHHLPDILNASQHEADPNFVLRDHFWSLLLDLPPTMLQKGLKSRPRHRDIARILEIVQKRQQDASKNPPLTILVLGGSVTEGVGCEKGHPLPNIRGRKCSWTQRLQSLVNQYLGFDAVQIINAASGGTTSGQALPLVKYWIYPEEVPSHGPDILWNAFATNDNFFGLYQRGVSTEDDTLHHVRTHVYQYLNDFYQTVQTSHPCHTPIIMHLDEYISGHAQGSIEREMIYNSVLTQMANWYQNFAVSSGDAFRMFTYADTTETTFSAHTTRGKQGLNPHFPFTGHQAIVYAILYNFLQVVLDYCHGTQTLQDYSELKNTSIQKQHKQHTWITQQQKDLVENVPPPPLSRDYDMDSIDLAWQAKSKETLCQEGVSYSGSPCSMSFVAGPEGRTGFIGSLRQYLDPFLRKKNGWKVAADESHGWSRKLGFVASKPNATAEFHIRNTTKIIQVLNFNTLKSYGDKWKGSLAQFTLFSSPNTVHTQKNTTIIDEDDYTKVHQVNISGIHNSESSITYSTTVKLDKPIPIHHNVKLHVQLIGGSSFKITGMMLCAY